MTVELINTGSELMLGRVLNTHQQWLCRRMADAGMPVARQVAIPDTSTSIREAVAEGLTRADLVIVTGGLGPTSDDLTRDEVAGLLGLSLREDLATRRNIEAFFASRGRKMPPRVLIQAQVPEGAIVVGNRHGTAPGLLIPAAAGRFGPGPRWLLMLPGPPRELRPMFDQEALPLLRERFPSASGFQCLTLRTCGIGESWVEEQLDPILPPLIQQGLQIGYCARTGEVDVRLVATGPAASEVVAHAESAVRDRLGVHIYGINDDSLEAVAIRLATEANARLVVAESCTGGYVTHRLTNVPGASKVVWGGWMTYDNAAKQQLLGVASEVLSDHGAVSEACARAMADGALRAAQATHALALTGIAGPSGGTPEKPVGTVFVALAAAGAETLVRRFHNPFDRETFKYVASQQALEMLRRSLLGLPPMAGIRAPAKAA
ncbi:MAG: competence/damage-inducible protein A [Verrucomicrobiales bacterium]|nr:competence/damage-inducible protein A [Verrucomicrobiales bacterium]